ncbi:lysoplasmalogenase family protein [Proteiniborus sp. MB09-C3]|uniref:lysoplasmalogenase family protein n=1 Tax=Proteiniborus sp. MB09-C3 TaxID=3050072 RepID=UPI00255412C2|nr:lysoplasmalogenase family protein [Proteiniborus sp. MB09-C3]WIV11575.1 lysoplasmalogenase family protein [Proteiniborus sp. MB09-C3]
MHVKTNSKLLAIKILLIVICILYIAFLYFDFFSVKVFISSSVVKFISIVLCFLLSVLIGKDYLDKENKLLLQSGLLITIIADFLLLFTDYFVLGTGIFSVVHILYAIRYERNKTKLILIRAIVILLIIVGIYLTINFFIIKIEVLFLSALFYAVSLIISTIKAIKACKYDLLPFPNKYLIAFGMVLFLLCDVNVGIFNIISLINISSGIINLLYNISGVLMWFFYLPSQVLISLSGYNFSCLSKK